jgi:hypothetical protein
MDTLKQLKDAVFQWAVVGAGPAGIAAVGRLIDSGILPEQILWIDPCFRVGDLGAYWSQVSSNTKVKYFNSFLQASTAFAYEYSGHCVLNDLDPEDTCTLSHIVEPLQWISEQLLKLVTHERGVVQQMNLLQRIWSLRIHDKIFQARNVILSTGAVPSNLNYPGVDIVPFEVAIDKDKLKSSINLNDTYAVFGSSHSAIIILRYLVDLGVKRVINFYRSPCRYAIDMGDWILFDNTGLKGETAQWARECIDGEMPQNLERYNTMAPNIARYLPECDKVVYAVGFEKRKNLLIGDYEDTQHNPHVGIIGPGLFGLGIAYPELKTDPFGSTESQVGLWKFMVYLNRVLPVWFKYHT